MGNIPVEGLAGTQTEKNLHAALAGEAQAYVKYQWYAKKARKDGLIEISNTFNQIADNEKEHAEIWFKYLGGIGSTDQNLSACIGGEHYEWATMYADFAKTAAREGFNQIAAMFERIASVEKSHEGHYQQLKNALRSGNMFKSDAEDTQWECLNCGFVVQGKDAPDVCPACAHIQGFFKRKTEN